MTIYHTLVSVADLDRLSAEGDVAIFDCQFDLGDPDVGLAAYRAAHIPGARYLHLDNDLSSPPSGDNGRHPLPDAEGLSRTLRAAGVKEGQQIVFYDAAGGAYAARGWWLMRWMGHTAVAVLDGGFPAWQAAGKAVESGEAQPVQPGTFTPPARDAVPTVTARDVLANIDSGKRVVVDARTAERWRGEQNPLDPVAGHIPGARNRFFRDNLGAGDMFKPASELAAEIDAVLKGVSPSDVILQCGSGVTACHLALAMEIAGRRGAALYPGSWSEWIADPSRPVEREV